LLRACTHEAIVRPCKRFPETVWSRSSRVTRWRRRLLHRRAAPARHTAPSRREGVAGHFCVNAHEMLSARPAIAVPISQSWRTHTTRRRQKSSLASRQARPATSG
jgi:hypothetical protein